MTCEGNLLTLEQIKSTFAPKVEQYSSDKGLSSVLVRRNKEDQIVYINPSSWILIEAAPPKPERPQATAKE